MHCVKPARDYFIGHGSPDHIQAGPSWQTYSIFIMIDLFTLNTLGISAYQLMGHIFQLKISFIMAGSAYVGLTQERQRVARNSSHLKKLKCRGAILKHVQLFLNTGFCGVIRRVLCLFGILNKFKSVRAVLNINNTEANTASQKH